MAGVMVDTNIFYILLLGSVDEARRVAEILEDKKLYTLLQLLQSYFIYLVTVILRKRD